MNDGPDNKTVQEKLPDDKAEMTFYGHFYELRRRLVRILTAVLAGTLLCFTFAPDIYAFLSGPIHGALPNEGDGLIFISPVEPFFVYLKISILTGVLLTSPYVFFQIWRFVAPGLYENERRVILPMSIASAVTFIAGAAFCYAVVLPLGLNALISAGATESFSATAQISMASYYDLTIRLIIAFGIVFEMPVFSIFLTRLGLMTHMSLIRHWRSAVVIIFILAALLTPPDVVTQLALGLPMCALYGISILLSRAVASGRGSAP